MLSVFDDMYFRQHMKMTSLSSACTTQTKNATACAERLFFYPLILTHDSCCGPLNSGCRSLHWRASLCAATQAGRHWVAHPRAEPSICMHTQICTHVNKFTHARARTHTHTHNTLKYAYVTWVHTCARTHTPGWHPGGTAGPGLCQESRRKGGAS